MVNVMNSVKAAGFGLLCSFSLYVSCLSGVERYSASHSKPVRSQEELERIVNEEKAKLGCKVEIKSALSSESVGRSFFTFPDSVSRLEVGGDWANESTIKHEMYHVCDGHLDGPSMSTFWGKVHYTFVSEPQAALYAAFDLKL